MHATLCRVVDKKISTDPAKSDARVSYRIDMCDSASDNCRKIKSCFMKYFLEGCTGWTKVLNNSKDPRKMYFGMYRGYVDSTLLD